MTNKMVVTQVSVCFVHRDLRAELSGRETLHQSYHGSGVHHHRGEGQRAGDARRTGLVFQRILPNMCVCVSICVGEMSRAGLTTPNRQACQLFLAADSSYF